VPGIQTNNSSSEALNAVQQLAELGANQRDATLVGSGLRLFERPLAPNAANEASALVSPFALGRAYELLLAPPARRKTGSHLTPESIARNLVALMPQAQVGDRVLDPAVGGAAFLLAAADQLVDAGAAPQDVVGQLFGIDIDLGAVAVAEAALALWALDQGLEPTSLPNVQAGDGLLDALPTVERVVGNPPFLNQLRSTSSHTADRRAQLRERWGPLVTAYTDDAWLFLAAGVDALTVSGSLAMVQPVSILAARHAQAVREQVHADASVTSIWVGRDRVFDAAVQVCGLVVERGAAPRVQSMQRRVGANFDMVDTFAGAVRPHEWGNAAAAAVGVPRVQLASTAGIIGDLATATAGFRDQFYGFVPFVAENPTDHVAQDKRRLVTVGMIDVLTLGWGSRSFKFAKRDFTRPVVDLTALETGDPRLADWVRARLRPKILMASQTRVVEVIVDADGDCIPATPVLSIEPHSLDGEELWMLAAALSAPAISAQFAGAQFGTAMAITALKVSARDVLSAPLPTQVEPWQAAAKLLQIQSGDLEEFGALMGQAYECDPPGLLQWWLQRVPNR